MGDLWLHEWNFDIIMILTSIYHPNPFCLSPVICVGHRGWCPGHQQPQRSASWCQEGSPHAMDVAGWFLHMPPEIHLLTSDPLTHHPWAGQMELQRYLNTCETALISVKKGKIDICIFYHFFMLRWHRYLKSLLQEDKDCRFMLQSQYHGCWCPRWHKSPRHQQPWYWPK